MQAGVTEGDLNHNRWTHAVHGEPVDDRGAAAVKFARENSDHLHQLHYDPTFLQITYDGKSFTAEEPELAFAGFNNARILIETTTLSLVEILICLRTISQLKNHEASLVYIEPESYFRPQQSRIIHRRDFDLSDEVRDFSAVPGNVVLIRPNRPAKAVVFVGFEGQRLNRFLQQTELSPSSCSIVFGVPAFHPGWEMHAFENNFRALKGQEMSGRIYFCGAQNPLSAYHAAERFYQSCSPNERLLLVPIGTKPHGIGAALFACEHSDIGLVYDHPTRKRDRTKRVGSWHLFDVRF